MASTDTSKNGRHRSGSEGHHVYCSLSTQKHNGDAFNCWPAACFDVVDEDLHTHLTNNAEPGPAHALHLGH